MEQRRADLIEGHVGLVDQIVGHLALRLPTHVDRSELLAGGRLGLVEAAERYDFDQPVAFRSFAAPRIRGAALDVVRSADWTPRRTRALARRADDVAAELLRRDGEAPSDAQLAEALEIPLPALQRMRAQIGRGSVRALDHLVVDGRPAEDFLDDPDALDAETLLLDVELRRYLRAAIEALPERHRLVVTALYLDGRTTEDVAALLDVSRSRVSQLRADALDRLRDGLARQYDEPTHADGSGRMERRRAEFAAEIAARSH